MSNLKRELSRRIRDLKFEWDENGNVVFAGAGLCIGGTFTVENLTRGDGVAVAHNLVVNQGLNHILDVILGTASKVATWYIAPFAGNVTPQANLTAANFNSTTTEFTNYTQGTRQAFTPSAASSGGVIGNLSNRAEITIGTPGQDVIHGLGILSANGKEATTGVLLSAARLSSPRADLLEGDVIALGYSLQVSDAS